MMTQPIRSGFRTGITFAVIIIFLALTGFTATIASLVGKLLGSSNQLNLVPYLFIVLALLGFWNGALAAKPHKEEEKVRSTILSSLSAGLTTGLLVAGYSLINGWLLNHEVDPRPYLSMVSPDSMRLFLFEQEMITGSIVHFALMVISAVLSGVLFFYLKNISIGGMINKPIILLSQRIRDNSLFIKVLASPFTKYVMFALAAVLAYFLPTVWGSYWNYIIGTIGIYVIMGLGLNIIVGFAGQLVLGYVAFFAIGAYSMALLTAPQPHALDVNFWIALLISIILAALTGILLGLPILSLRGDYLAIVTLGFGEIIRIMLRSDVLTPLTAGPRGVRNIGGPTLFNKPFTSDAQFLYLIILAVILIIFITNRLQNSRTGRAWVSIREDEVAAKATGVNNFQQKLLALAIGAAFAGLGGALFASRNQFTGPEDHTLMVSINVLCLVIVGGMGSIPGVLLGSIVLKGFPEMLRELDIYRLMVFGALLVVMMIIRPEGLWPARSTRLEEQFESDVPIPKDQPGKGPPLSFSGMVHSDEQAAKKEPENNGGSSDSLS